MRRWLLLLVLSSPSFAHATTVASLQAQHRHGQTFLIWSAPPGTNWRYRIYRRTQPISTTVELATATLVGSVGDSTWADRRLSQLRGQLFAYSVDSLAAPLVASQALCVLTPAQDRVSFYAVTAQAGAGSEDLTIVPGGNALALPVSEFLALTRPVFQRTLLAGNLPFDIYATWANPEDTPLQPAMTTSHGFAFDHAVVRGTPGGPLHMRPHARGGSLLTVLSGSGEPGEWRVALDDPLYSSTDRNSFWYGYHTGYDLSQAAPIAPLTGSIRSYTLNRIVHTFGWARRELPVDTTRAIASGGSMGAIGSLQLAFAVPQWLAGVHLIVPKFDFSFTTDPNPANAWNAGSPERLVGDHLWGSVSTSLSTDGGLPVYDQLDDGFLALQHADAALPWIVAFNGRHDVVVGWAEKLGFYDAMRTARHGGAFFWDEREHSGAGAAWTPMQNVRQLYRLRTNLSYPALSAGDADDDPGTGSLASGDTLGTINGMFDWDPVFTDEPDGWGCVLRTRDLVSVWGTRVAPESASVDVTPRRLQRFHLLPGEPLAWQVRRLADGVIVRSGQVTVEAGGRVTVPGVRVFRSGSAVSLVRPATLAAGGPAPATSARLEVAMQPARGSIALRFDGATAAFADAVLFDVSGRRVRSGRMRPIAVGVLGLLWDTSGLAPGVYLARAESAGQCASARIIVLD